MILTLLQAFILCVTSVSIEHVSTTLKMYWQEKFEAESLTLEQKLQTLLAKSRDLAKHPFHEGTRFTFRAAKQELFDSIHTIDEYRHNLTMLDHVSRTTRDDNKT